MADDRAFDRYLTAVDTSTTGTLPDSVPVFVLAVSDNDRVLRSLHFSDLFRDAHDFRIWYSK